MEPQTPRTIRRPDEVAVGLLLFGLLVVRQLDLAGLDLRERAAQRGAALDEAGGAADDFLDAALDERRELEASADLVVETIDLADGVDTHESVPPALDEPGNLADSPVQVVVDYDRVVLAAPRKLDPGRLQPAGDDLGGVGSAAPEAAFELGVGRRRHEHVERVDPVPAQRRGPLDVDDEQAGEPAPEHRLDGVPRRAVEVPV